MPRNDPTFDPDIRLPFSLRLAQFLLQASDQLGQYGQGMQKQSAGAADILAQQDVLDERRREADLKEQDRQAKAAQEARRRRAAGVLFATPTTREQTFQVEDTLPATEMGAPNAEAGAPLPILRNLVTRRRTTLSDAMQGLGPDMEALTADDLAKAAKIFPESAALDPAKLAQAVKDIGGSNVKDRSALVRFLFGSQAPDIEFESPTVKGSERKAQLEADVLEGLPLDKRAVAAFPSLREHDSAERNPFAGLDPTKLDAIVATPDRVLEGTDLARRFGGAAALKSMARDALTRIEGRTTRQAAETAAAVERARVGTPNPPPEAQQKVRLGLVEAEDTLTDLKGLLPRVNLTRIAGGIQPWITDILQKGRLGPIPIDPANFGGQLSTDEITFLAQLQDYADKVLRQRSGAQINEQEFGRMLTFLANPNVRPEVIAARLDLQHRSTSRARQRLEEQWREFGYIIPKGAPPAATLGSGGPVALPPGFKPPAK